MLIPHAALILVVDRSRASLLRNKGKLDALDLELIETRKQHLPQERALASDGPGRAFESLGPSRSAYEGTERRQQLEEKFGTEALAMADAGASDGCPLIVVAPPHMLGVLRKARRASPRRPIICEIGKDLVELSPTELRDRLQDFS